jgi:3-hydroxyacyl-CoA dehydrogenase
VSVVEYRKDGEIAVLTVNNPPVNALSMAVRIALLDLVRQTDADPAVKAVVLIGADKTFVAGADIREFGKKMEGPTGRSSMEAIEASKKPFIAALHGTALGGGLELALAAHYRVALPGAKVGLPEVNIGVIPGAGGTQRLPRLVGVEAALDLITAGKHIDAKTAQRLGVVDALVDGQMHEELLKGALAFARRIVAENRPLRRVRDLDDKISGVDPAIFAAYREKNAKKWKGLLAPWKIVDCIEAACTRPWDEAYALEDRAFFECRESPQRAALSHIFFAEREAAKIPGLPADVKAQPVRRVAVVGAGTMGGGIAMAFANSGIDVVQLEMSAEALERGRGIVRRNYETSVSRGSMAQAKADAAMARIGGTLAYEELKDCDLVIEAVFEDMKIKQEVFAKLDAVMKPGAILATNTSTLDIDRIGAATQRPEAVVGTHFFSPANVMKLLEVVRGAKSAPQTLATAMGLAKQIGKVAVLAGNCDGFIGNRILAAYGRQADFLLEEGATPWQIDGALKAFGLPMGMFLMRDMAGLDVGWRIRQYREQFRDKSLRYSPVADRICELGRFGQKTGAGYYKYPAEKGGREATPDPEIEQLIVQVSKDLGIARKPISDAEIVDRILLAMVNEGAKIVGEGYAARASDIDVTYIYGYGFPRYEGGPMFWAERRGLARVYDKVLTYHREHGPYWEPAPLLEKAAKLGSWKAAEGS